MMIDSTTAMIAPGTFGRNLLNPRMIARVPAAKARVGRLVSPRWVSIYHCCWNQVPDPFAIPSMSGI